MFVSKVSENVPLAELEIREVVVGGLSGRGLEGKRVLVIIPDHTRSGPTGLFFRIVSDALLGRAKKVDFLIALGTHPRLSEDKINELLKISAEERCAKYGSVGVFNHQWDSPAALKQVGVLSKRQVEELSRGMLSIEVPVLVNRMIFDYDHLIICGPVFPHEGVGFSGGHKYLFPGIGAPEVIHFTHWLGALITNPVINGTRETPVRSAIEAAADLIPVQRSLIGYVVDSQDVLGVFAGAVYETWQAAAELSAKTQIVYCDRPYKTVLSCSPKMYDDLWVAGKCMYKLEPVVADGGELIIYAPHIDEVSYSHGKVLDEIGYHVRDYFVKLWDKFKGYPWGLVAHSTHVKGVGCYDDGVEQPRVKVILATRIPESRCRQINLGYMNPDTIDPADYADREDERVLLVPKAGETLYRLKDMSKFSV
ncbi:MAG: lactate racemase domain-containing protein [Planctomycetota bacterium]|jgi:nickel-dependent lactate racemase